MVLRDALVSLVVLVYRQHAALFVCGDGIVGLCVGSRRHCSTVLHHSPGLLSIVYVGSGNIFL